MRAARDDADVGTPTWGRVVIVSDSSALWCRTPHWALVTATGAGHTQRRGRARVEIGCDRRARARSCAHTRSRSTEKKKEKSLKGGTFATPSRTVSDPTHRMP